MTSGPYLVVGLGNPGPTYAFTRHNVGFWAVSDLAERHGATFSLNKQQRAEVATATLAPVPGMDAVRMVLAKPTTYMNESGIAVRAVAAFHKIPAANVIAIHDELDLDPGQLRMKFGGGDNGHNGLKSMRAHLGTGDFLRVRVGIGRPPGRQDPADFVLRAFSTAERRDLPFWVQDAADAVELLVRHGLETAQNQVHSA